MIHRGEKYWFVRNPWGSGEINVIFINANCIRTVVIETWVERTSGAWKRREIYGQFRCRLYGPLNLTVRQWSFQNVNLSKQLAIYPSSTQWRILHSKKFSASRGTWVAQSVKRPDFGSGHDLAVCGFKPHIRLWADSSEPGTCFRFCVSLSLPLPRSHSPKNEYTL